jgi:hypothetical protein
LDGCIPRSRSADRNGCIPFWQRSHFFPFQRLSHIDLPRPRSSCFEADREAANRNKTIPLQVQLQCHEWRCACTLVRSQIVSMNDTRRGSTRNESGIDRPLLAGFAILGKVLGMALRGWSSINGFINCTFRLVVTQVHLQDDATSQAVMRKGCNKFGTKKRNRW